METDTNEGAAGAPPLYLVNKVLTVFMKGDSKVTYKVLESTVKRAFSDTEISEAKKLLWDRFPALDPGETKVDKGKWIDRHKLEFKIEDIYKRLAFLGNNDSLPPDCICVPWNEIDSLLYFLSDEGYELRAEKKVGNDAIDERFKQIETQNKDFVKILTELNAVVSGGRVPKPIITLPDARVSDLIRQDYEDPGSPEKKRRYETSFPVLGAVHSQQGGQYVDVARQHRDQQGLQ